MRSASNKLTDQGLPQDVVASYFEAQDLVILWAMKPEEAAEQVQEAITRFKKAQQLTSWVLLRGAAP